jgi:hypothetical protein
MLYLDFINLFMMLLQLTGQRRDQVMGVTECAE